MGSKRSKPHVWTKFVIKNIKSHQKFPFAVDGLRFLHDVELFRQNFSEFLIVKVETDERQRMEAYKRSMGDIQHQKN